MVFAKETTPALTGLVKKLDAAVAQHKSDKLCSFLVVCNDDKDLEDNLKKLAEKEKIEHVTLTIDNPAGPKPMKLAKGADVTVVLYVHKTAKVNRVFKTGELTAAAADQVLADLPKILAKDDKKAEKGD